MDDGSSITIAAAHALLAQQGGKLRCQAPFRESYSLAAFVSLDAHGNPFVFDSGTGNKHMLPEPDLTPEAQTVISRMVGAISSRAAPDTDPLLVRYCVEAGLVNHVLSRCFRNAASKNIMVLSTDGAVTSFRPSRPSSSP